MSTDQNIAPIYGSIYSSSSGSLPGRDARLIDGIRDTDHQYVSDTNSGEWVIVDLGTTRTLSGFKVWCGYSANTYQSLKDYRIETSINSPTSFIPRISGVVSQPTVVGGVIQPTFHETVITEIEVRYVRIYLDTNRYTTGVWGLTCADFEIYSADVQQDQVDVFSDAEIYIPENEITVASDAYIINAPIFTDTVSVTSDAEIIDTRVDVLSDAHIAFSDSLTSNAHIEGTEDVIVLSDAMIYHSGSTSRDVFTMGKGSFDGFPYSGSTLIYCTNTSSSDEVIVADMITSSIMDMNEIVLPLGYQNYDWQYDWVVRTYDRAQYKFEVRTGETPLNLSAATFSSIVLGQVISANAVSRYHQWRCHVWASGSGDFELHQFSIKGYVDHPADLLYSSLNAGEFTTVSKVETRIDKPYEPMNMAKKWEGSYIPGDVNGDGVVDYDDLLYMTAWMFYSGSAPDPIRRADVNDDGATDINDLLYLTAYLLENGPPPYRRDESGFE